MDPARTIAEDQTSMAGISADLAEKTMKSGEKTINTLEQIQGYQEHYESRVLNHEERLIRQADREEKKARYDAFADNSVANNPVGVDREVAANLMNADIDEETIEAILQESPEFQELAEIQGEEKARHYLNLIIDDAARQKFLDEMQEQIQEAEILDQEEEQ